jgi:hypothetical protein
MEQLNENVDYIALQKSRDIKKKYIAQTWNSNEEDILQVWAEKASGWAWLHDKSQRYYLSQSNIFTYPSIILNTISGDSFQTVVQDLLLKIVNKLLKKMDGTLIGRLS